jgi:hypothetical protein
MIWGKFKTGLNLPVYEKRYASVVWFVHKRTVFFGIPLVRSVADPAFYFDADPDPTFNSEEDPDLTIPFDADPDPTTHIFQIWAF